MNTPTRLILASGSSIRRTLLENAGLEVETILSRIDEDTIKTTLIDEGHSPRDIADALAEGKARKVALKNLDAFTIGCDQTLSFKGALISKAASRDEARDILASMRGERHILHSAAVIYHDGEPVWRHIGEVRLTMHPVSDAYLDDYLDRNWDSVCDAVGAYKLEQEGIRLFSRIDGTYFDVLGLPLTPLLSYLGQRGIIAT